MWYYATDGHGRKDMVVLPYKDRLELFSRYLQQLVMESLGKGFDLSGNLVNQGLTVYGNKGSTDQHAYVQQLREGLANFFVVFIEVLRDRHGASFEVEPQITSGDYVFGFLLGTRAALFENRRESITLTLQNTSPGSIGALIALFERAVGLYATLINVNAYHQPGVEAGKKAAESVISLQQHVLKLLADKNARTAHEIATVLSSVDTETIFKLCQHLVANDRLVRLEAANPFDSKYRVA
jgi:glucose-6-phosphate isomerase